MTARRKEEELVRAFERGADDYLTKPVFVPGLLARIKAHLRSKVLFEQVEGDRCTLQQILELTGTILASFDERDACLCRLVCRELAAQLQNHSLRRNLDQNLEQLQDARDRLLQSEKLSSVGQFVAGIANELNDPLAGIISFSQLLLKSHQSPFVRQSLGRIAQEAERCVFISGMKPTEEMQAVMSAAGNSFLTKPFSLNELMSSLELVLGRASFDEECRGAIHCARELPANRILLGAMESRPYILQAGRPIRWRSTVFGLP